MSEKKKKDVIKKTDKFEGEHTDDFYLIITLLLLFGFGFGGARDTRIDELEKKVARLEGQMSMIGGKIS